MGRRRGLRGPATRVAPRVAPAVHWDSAHGGACGNAPPCLLPPCPLLRSVGAQIVPCNADAGARLGSCKPSALARDDGRLAMGLGVLPGGWVFMWLCTPPTRPRPTRCAVRVAGPVEASQRAPSPVATDSSRRGTPTRGAPRALQPVAPHDKAAPMARAHPPGTPLRFWSGAPGCDPAYPCEPRGAPRDRAPPPAPRRVAALHWSPYIAAWRRPTRQPPWQGWNPGEPSSHAPCAGCAGRRHVPRSRPRVRPPPLAETCCSLRAAPRRTLRPAPTPSTACFDCHCSPQRT